jgi:uncharacterized membrane protein
MAFCGKCGSSVASGVTFCPNCGAPVGAAPVGAPPMSGPGPVASTGLQENVAGLLAYVLGWLTGIIFLLVDKRPFVRFHAAQSIVVFGSLFILRMIFFFGIFGGFFWIWSLLSLLVSLLILVLWIVLMIQAYQGKWFEVPIAAGIAKSIAGSVNV